MLGRPYNYTLKRLDPETAEFAELVEESRLEGYWMLVRLLDDWGGNRNRFSRRGEAVLAAWRENELAGVCGLNVDPYVEGRREGRVRHLYVRPTHRHNGVGKLLLDAVVDKARRHFPVLNVRAAEDAFPFYEALGFARLEGEAFATHRLTFKPETKGGRARRK